MQTDQKTLQTIQQIIQTHLANPKLKGELIAAELGVSRMTVHRLLKRTTAQNTREYILQFRIKYTQQQLLTTTKFIYQIAAEVGCFDAQQFAKVFKKTTGITPSQFRKSKR
jgi:two-component system response regulator YesN